MQVKIINGAGEENVFQARSFNVCPSYQEGDEYEEGPYGPIWVPSRNEIYVDIVMDSYPQWVSDIINDMFANTPTRSRNRNISLKPQSDEMNSFNNCTLTSVNYWPTDDYSIETSLTFVSWNLPIVTSTPKKKPKPQLPKIDWRQEGF